MASALFSLMSANPTTLFPPFEISQTDTNKNKATKRTNATNATSNKHFIVFSPKILFFTLISLCFLTLQKYNVFSNPPNFLSFFDKILLFFDIFLLFFDKDQFKYKSIKPIGALTFIKRSSLLTSIITSSITGISISLPLNSTESNGVVVFS